MTWLTGTLLLFALCCIGGCTGATTDNVDCPTTVVQLISDGCLEQCLYKTDRRCLACNRTCVNVCDSLAKCRLSSICLRGLRTDDNGCLICECREEIQCDNTLEGLVADGCAKDCLYRDGDGCPQCRDGCSTQIMECNADTCRDGKCVLLGSFGVLTCVPFPDTCTREDEEEEVEEVEVDPLPNSFSGISERDALRILGSDDVECEDGTQCSDNGMCEPVEGPCRRTTGGNCDNDGYYRPLQCRRDGDIYVCRCVARDGVARTDWVRVVNKENLPDCAIYRPCVLELRGVRYTVVHGQSVLNFATCEKCRCNDSQLVGCVSTQNRLGNSDCDLTPPPRPRNCEVRGVTIPHGEKRRVGRCNACGCRDGIPTCTRIDCPDDDEEEKDPCERCRRLPHRPICGLDGRTYRSLCHARNCSDLAVTDYLPAIRPCIRTDVCQLYPCDEGERCVRLGGVICLRRGGCNVRKRRICVNITRLTCSTDNSDLSVTDFRETKVCGRDNRTYPSLCRLLQDTPLGEVKYAGECERDECRGGPVCGMDGVTYDSICELRSQSSGVRVDYRGECDEDDTTPIDDICRRVRASGRCQFNADNCGFLVRPEDGCCPVCGGVVILAIDLERLRDNADRNPDVDTFDKLIDRLHRTGIFSRNSSICELEASYSSTGSVEITLQAKNPDDSEFCYNLSVKVADKFATVPGDATPVTFPPDLTLFGAATAAPLENVPVDPVPGHAPSLHMAVGLFVAMVFGALTLRV